MVVILSRYFLHLAGIDPILQGRLLLSRCYSLYVQVCGLLRSSARTRRRFRVGKKERYFTSTSGFFLLLPFSLAVFCQWERRGSEEEEGEKRKKLFFQVFSMDDCVACGRINADTHCQVNISRRTVVKGREGGRKKNARTNLNSQPERWAGERISRRFRLTTEFAFFHFHSRA